MTPAARKRAATEIRRLAARISEGVPLFETTRNAPRKIASASDSFKREWFKALQEFDDVQRASSSMSPSARAARLSAARTKLEDSWRATIRRGYERSFRLGYGARGRAGATRLTTLQIAQLDPSFESMVRSQAEYAARFAREYASGALQARGRMGVGPRSTMYANSLKAGFGAGAVAGGTKGERIDWKLGACDHCPDCPLLAASGPFTKNTLPTYPGAGKTVCATNCCCHLVFRPGPRKAADVDAPPGAVSAFIDPSMQFPSGYELATAEDVAFLRDLELRRNFARRKIAELPPGRDRDKWMGVRSELQGTMNDYRRDRGIRWTPRFSVGDALTSTDIALKDVDDIFLRGLDGSTISRADLKLVNDLIRQSNDALMGALGRMGIPPASPAVPTGAVVLKIKTQAADPDDGAPDDFVSTLKVDESARRRESKSAALLEDERHPTAAPRWTVNLVGMGLLASFAVHLALLKTLRGPGAPYFVELAPLDVDWPLIVSASGSWVRGEGGEVRRLLEDAGIEYMAAPWVGP